MSYPTVWALWICKLVFLNAHLFPVVVAMSYVKYPAREFNSEADAIDYLLRETECTAQNCADLLASGGYEDLAAAVLVEHL